MSAIFDGNFRCSVCGCEFTAPELWSTSEFGSPDLDLRPAELNRWTMEAWMQCCPNCGYVSRHIDEDGTQHKEYIATAEYITCEGNTSLTGLARNFYRYGLLCLREKKYIAAYYAFLRAAWACDDEELYEQACICRNRAAKVFYQNGGFNDFEIGFVNADVLRRAGRFKEARKLCKSLNLKNISDEDFEYASEDEESDFIKKAVGFQLKLCRKKDTKCYSFDDCSGSLLQRLLRTIMRLYDRKYSQENN